MDEHFQPEKDFKWKCDLDENEITDYIGGMSLNLPPIMLDNMKGMYKNEINSSSRGNTDVETLQEFDREIVMLIEKLNKETK